MPTGYAAPIEDRNDYSFAEYTWSCARAFDIWCRDNDGPVPLVRTADVAWESDHLERSRAELARLRGMTTAEVASWALEQYATVDDSRAKTLESYAVQRERYAAMRARVEAWTPPTALHEGLRDFMLQQIDASLPPTEAQLREWGPKRTADAELHRESIARLETSIRNAEQRIADAHRRAAEMTEWLRALNESVPRPQP